MSEMLTGPKKIVDGLTEVFRGLTRMCEGMAEQIELLEFTSEDAEDEDKLLPPAKLPAVDTAPRVQDVPHPRKKPGEASSQTGTGRSDHDGGDAQGADRRSSGRGKP